MGWAFLFRPAQRNWPRILEAGFVSSRNISSWTIPPKQQKLGWGTRHPAVHPVLKADGARWTRTHFLGPITTVPMTRVGCNAPVVAIDREHPISQPDAKGDLGNDLAAPCSPRPARRYAPTPAGSVNRILACKPRYTHLNVPPFCTRMCTRIFPS